MSDTKANITRFQTTEPIMLVGPAFDKPRPYIDPKTKKASGEPKFTCWLVVDPAGHDFADMKKTVAEVARARWPGRPISELALPFARGDDKIAKFRRTLEASGKSYDNQRDYLAGKVIIATRSLYPPLMAAVINGKLVDIDKDDAPLIQKFFWTGAMVHAILRFNAYDEVGSNQAGIGAYLNEVLATGQGKRIGPTRSASASFAGYAGKYAAENPTTGTEDDIPF